jgi:hypothetical protein
LNAQGIADAHTVGVILASQPIFTVTTVIAGFGPDVLDTIAADIEDTGTQAIIGFGGVAIVAFLGGGIEKPIATGAGHAGVEAFVVVFGVAVVAGLHPEVDKPIATRGGQTSAAGAIGTVISVALVSVVAKLSRPDFSVATSGLGAVSVASISVFEIAIVTFFARGFYPISATRDLTVVFTSIAGPLGADLIPFAPTIGIDLAGSAIGTMFSIVTDFVSGQDPIAAGGERTIRITPISRTKIAVITRFTCLLPAVSTIAGAFIGTGIIINGIPIITGLVTILNAIATAPHLAI